jgi:hypothetical protein
MIWKGVTGMEAINYRRHVPDAFTANAYAYKLSSKQLLATVVNIII